MLIKLATVFILAFILVSCTNHITMDQIQYISKGIRYQELKQYINIRPKHNYEIEYLDTVYSIYVFPMVVGTTPITTSTPGYGGIPIYTTTHKPATEEYFFIFDKNGLFFWGFLAEIKNEGDQLIQALGSLVDEGFEELKRQRHQWR